MSELLNGAEGAGTIERDAAHGGAESAAPGPKEKPATPNGPEASNEALVEDLTKKAHDLDAIRKSVEDAALISGTLWFSYLFTLLYIAIAAGAVTHKDLLLENAVKLPFLNVELPLVAFFFLAPILFIIAHAYTLMHFVMLAAKAGAYSAELERQVPDPDGEPAEVPNPARTDKLRATRLGLRRQLPSNIFVQFLAGPRDIRQGGLGFMLQAVAWISLVIGPVLLLLLIQIQFLPYHLEGVTWVQRFAILADVILLWFLWPAVLASRSKIQWPRLWRSPVLASLALLSLLPIGFAFLAARFPGEWLDAQYGTKQWIPANRVTAWLGASDSQNKPISTSIHDLLFNGNVDILRRRRKSLFSNTLVVPSFDALDFKGINDQKKLDWAKHTLDLHGRHLEGAILSYSDLRKVDFDGAQLQGALLIQAQLQGASLFYANFQGAFLGFVQLQGAWLRGAQLQGAWLRGAQLQGAELASAQLQGAQLQSAQLQGASLYGVKLEGASLDSALLQGADFSGAVLIATDLAKTEIWGARFLDAKLDRIFENGLSEARMPKQDFVKLKDDIAKSIPENDIRARGIIAQVLKRIEILDPDNTSATAPDHTALYAAKADELAYQQALARELKNIACSGHNSAESIVHGMILSKRVAAAGPFAHNSRPTFSAVPPPRSSSAPTRQN